MSTVAIFTFSSSIVAPNKNHVYIQFSYSLVFLNLERFAQLYFVFCDIDIFEESIPDFL